MKPKTSLNRKFVMAALLMITSCTLASAQKKVGILLYDYVIPFDYVPSAEIFRVAQMSSAFDVFSVGTTSKVRIQGTVPDSVEVNYLINNALSLDVLIVPGGNWPEASQDKELLSWLRMQADQGVIIYSVCTGSYLLAKAGILEGKKVTSINAQLDQLRKLAPKAKVYGDIPFVRDENIVTSAGAFTGIDAALFVVSLLASKEAAQWIAETYLDYGSWTGSFEGKVD